MTKDQIRAHVLAALETVAPEAGEIDGAANLRDALDLDSIDFLNFVVALHKSVGVEVPEGDYRRMGSLDACVEYLATRLPA